MAERSTDGREPNRWPAVYGYIRDGDYDEPAIATLRQELSRFC